MFGAYSFARIADWRNEIQLLQLAADDRNITYKRMLICDSWPWSLRPKTVSFALAQALHQQRCFLRNTSHLHTFVV